MVRDDDALVGAREAAEMADVSANLLHKWAREREAGLDSPGPPHVRLGPNTRRWRRSDIRTWIRQSVVGPSGSKKAAGE